MNAESRVESISVETPDEREAFAAGDYPAAPYPGGRPAFSFVQDAGVGHRLHQDGEGWHVGDVRLDDWLSARRRAPAHRRHHVLAYGSNACPAKIDWLRTELGLPGPVVVLRARCTGLSAVWAAGHRVVDDQRPATLAAAPGIVEHHGVWLATDEQLAVLDRCEGRGDRYRLAHVHTGRVELETGQRLRDPLAYVGLAAVRLPLLVGGEPVRCTDVAQAAAKGLIGAAAESDGLSVTPVG